MIYQTLLNNNCTKTVKVSRLFHSTSNQTQNMQAPYSFPFVAQNNEPIQHIKVITTSRDNLENSGTFLKQKEFKNKK